VVQVVSPVAGSTISLASVQGRDFDITAVQLSSPLPSGWGSTVTWGRDDWSGGHPTAPGGTANLVIVASGPSDTQWVQFSHAPDFTWGTERTNNGNAPLLAFYTRYAAKTLVPVVLGP
jgi:hypothetical protein